MCGLISMQKGTPTLDLKSLQIMQHRHHTGSHLLYEIGFLMDLKYHHKR